MVESRKKSPTKQTIKVFKHRWPSDVQPEKKKKNTPAFASCWLGNRVICQVWSPRPVKIITWVPGSHLDDELDIYRNGARKYTELREHETWLYEWPPYISVYIWFSSCCCHLSKSAAEKDVQWIFETTGYWYNSMKPATKERTCLYFTVSRS